MDISPIVIDGAWGTGKTEFSNKLHQFLKEEINDGSIIYLDAFKEDHCDDPLLSITAAIAKILPEDKKQSFINTALPAVKFGAKTILKAGVSWVLRDNSDHLMDGLEDEIKNASNDIIDSTIENLLVEHIHAEENINALKSKIASLSKDNKMVIIVDELDRCRPSFAISLLEKIKHIFDVEGVCFILVANLMQLKASINHVYGNAVDAVNYLEKFIKFTVAFPQHFEDAYNQSTHTSIAHWDWLVSNDESMRVSFAPFREHIIELFNVKTLSLREVETLFRHSQIYQAITNHSIGTQSPFATNLTRFIGIFTYCFSHEKNLTNINAYNLIKTISNTLNFKLLGVNNAQARNTPLYQVMLFGLMEESNMHISDLYPADNGSCGILRETYQRIISRNFNGFSCEKTLRNVFKTFSLNS